MKKLKVVETFSGIGSQAKALSRLKEKGILDYTIVNTADWDINAIMAYCMIHKKDFCIDDYTETDREIYDFLSKLTLSSDGKKPMSENALKLLSPEVRKQLYGAIKATNNLVSVTDIKGEDIQEDTDILTYSFPCQDLSICGYWHGNFSGIDREAHNRSGMLWEIERILLEMSELNKELPKFLLMENVTNILSPKHIDNFNDWKNTLERLGYINIVYCLNAKNFGIPQQRKRAYMISVLCNHNSVKEKIVKDYFEKNSLEKRSPSKIRLSLNDILSISMNSENYEKEALLSTPNDTKSRRRIYQDNDHLLIDGKVQENCIIKTLTTKQDRNPNSGVIEFKNNIEGKAQWRYLTPRECFMLMGFDNEDFEKVVSNKYIRNKKNRTKYYYSNDLLVKMAGNSIVVDVLEAIFGQISDVANFLDEY